MNFPLKLEFKKIALSPQVSVIDSNGELLFYVKQKLLKIKEEITVFDDRAQQIPLYHIKADRVIDYSARYHFTDMNGMAIGSVRRQGTKSLWKAHYDITDANGMDIFTVQEENPWIRMMDSFLGDIPFLGMFSGYFFNPVFFMMHPDGQAIFKVKKLPSMLESSFSIEKLSEISESEQITAVLSMLMMVLLERTRG